jgi:hypothetical protein
MMYNYIYNFHSVVVQNVDHFIHIIKCHSNIPLPQISLSACPPCLYSAGRGLWGSVPHHTPHLTNINP